MIRKIKFYQDKIYIPALIDIKYIIEPKMTNRAGTGKTSGSSEALRIIQNNPKQATDQIQTQLLGNSILSRENGVDIVFKDITYSVEIDGEDVGCLQKKQKLKKTLLQRVSGVCRQGQVTAIMGPSGAGKTTLLNVLACRIIAESGELLSNGRPYDYDSFGNFANYVMQTDVLMETLTVRETLQFAAHLKVAPSEREERVKAICKSMKLQKCIDGLVGGKLLKGISGGEKKRTSIAFQLISDPSVIVLDEPTSGLDSLTSYIIVSYLNDLSRQRGKTIIMTIHQPNSEIFKLFDRLFLLSEGHMVYQGPATEAIDYFSLRLAKPIPDLMNPPQFFIEVIYDLGEAKETSKMIEAYSSYMQPVVNEQILTLSAKNNKHQIRESKISMSQIFSALMHRDWINTLRNPVILKGKIFQTIFLAIYTGGVYFGAGRKNYEDIINWQAMVGYFFFLAISCMMSTLSPISLVFPLQRDVFLKEQSSRLYGVVPYFISRNIIQIPFLFLFPLFFNLIIYWMVGQANTAQQFFLFYFISVIVGFAGSSLGLFIGSISKDQKTGSALTPIIILPIFIFSGVFKNRANLPDWIGWIQYISPLKYGFMAMTINETNYKPSFVEQLNFDLGIWPAIGILIGLSFALRFMSLFFLWLLKTKPQ